MAQLVHNRNQGAQKVVSFCKQMLADGLTCGTGGNISVLVEGASEVAISPSAVDYDSMVLEDVVITDTKGVIRAARNNPHRVPSSELGMHLAVYQSMPEVRAVVHTHSPFATTLACMEKPLPPIHYLVCFAGLDVPCIPYYPFGSRSLASAASGALDANHRAVLLGHHGLLTCGNTIEEAYNMAQQLEFCCQLYIHMLACGDLPPALSEIQAREAMAALANYSQ